MLLSRVQAFALQRGTVYDLLVGRHLLPDIQLGVRKNAVFGGNVLNAVVHLLEVAAVRQIAHGGEVAALVDPHIPPVGFKIEVALRPAPCAGASVLPLADIFLSAVRFLRSFLTSNLSTLFERKKGAGHWFVKTNNPAPITL